MKNSINELYEVIKRNDNIDEDILKDIVIIDGAIVQNSDEKYKLEVLNSLEDKYKERLNGISYNKIKIVVDTKDIRTEWEKEINTLLGNLKVWIIRIVAIDMIKDDSLNSLITQIRKEEDVEKLYKELDKLDSILKEKIK